MTFSKLCDLYNHQREKTCILFLGPCAIGITSSFLLRFSTRSFEMQGQRTFTRIRQMVNIFYIRKPGVAWSHPKEGANNVSRPASCRKCFTTLCYWVILMVFVLILQGQQ